MPIARELVDYQRVSEHIQDQTEIETPLEIVWESYARELHKKFA